MAETASEHSPEAEEGTERSVAKDRILGYKMGASFITPYMAGDKEWVSGGFLAIPSLPHLASMDETLIRFP